MTKRKKTAAKTADTKLVRQAHGGALLPGGKPGNRGGAGALPSEVRAQLRGSAVQRIGILEQIIDNPKSTNADRLRAIDIELRYSLGPAEDDKRVDLGALHLAALMRKPEPPTPNAPPTVSARILPNSP